MYQKNRNGKAGGFRMQEFYVGQSYEFEKTIQEEDVEKFAEVTGDYNPLHMDEEYARTTMFGGRIAHGMIGAGIISGGLAMYLPGIGTTYLGQEITFKNPVHIGETVHVKLEIIELIKKSKFDIAKIKTTCTNGEGMIVIDGVATVIPPKV